MITERLWLLSKASLFVLSILLMGCNQVTAVITFPSDGATLYNPVALEANQIVEWRVDGQIVGSGTTWVGNLAEGPHRIEAKGAVLNLSVNTAYPTWQPKAITASTLLPDTSPNSKYLVITGNASSTPKSIKTSEALSDVASDQTPPALASSSQTPSSARWSFAEQLAASPHIGARAASRLQMKALGPEAQRVFRIPRITEAGADDVSTKLIYSEANTLAYLEVGGSPNIESDAVAIANTFDQHIVSRNITFFGASSDIDGNKKTILLFTPRLNASKLAIGFFASNDLLERNQDNPDSNQSELLYLGIPDASNPNFTKSSLSATACHEYAHLIHFSKKTLPRLSDSAPPFENIALSEGLAHLAEDLCGFNQTGGNLVFVSRFLEKTTQTSLTGADLRGNTDTPERRGAAYLLLRFLFEQAGGATTEPNETDGGVKFLRAIVSSPETGLQNLALQAGMSKTQLLSRWWLALGLSSVAPSSPQLPFQYQPPIPDPITGEPVGVNLKAGQVLVAPGINVNLNGVTLTQPSLKTVPSESVRISLVSGGTTVEPIPGFVTYVVRINSN